MAKVQLATSSKIYQLKVTLQGTRPPIWRRVQVASDVSLSKLHHILQTVMGWTDSHLHQFIAGQTFYGTPDPELSIERKNEKKVRVCDVLVKPKDKLVYEYDFGDGWEHDIVLEKILQADPARCYPICLDGKRACPPEDCGGVYGYYHFLEAIRGSDHPEHEEMVEWIGGTFDPEKFSPDSVNWQLHLVRRWVRGRA